MLHHAHQLVTNCFCLVFSAEQVADSGFIRAWWKQLLEMMQLRAVRVKQSSKVVDQKIKTTLKRSVKVKGYLSHYT